MDSFSAFYMLPNRRRKPISTPQEGSNFSRAKMKGKMIVYYLPKPPSNLTSTSPQSHLNLIATPTFDSPSPKSNKTLCVRPWHYGAHHQTSLTSYFRPPYRQYSSNHHKKFNSITKHIQSRRPVRRQRAMISSPRSSATASRPER